MILTALSLIGNPLQMLAFIIAFLSALFISMPFHEFAHAHAAYKEGDYTAKALKRYTLAPFAHIDKIGLLMLLFFSFGFARPVPVDSRNFKRGKKSELRVAFAGILTNLLIGTVACFIYCLLQNVWPQFFTDFGFFSELYGMFFVYVINLNFMFAFFNILPIYPLDGYRAVSAISKPNNRFLEFMRRYGSWIFLIFLIFGIFDLYLDFFAWGLIDLLQQGFNAFFNLFI